LYRYAPLPTYNITSNIDTNFTNETIVDDMTSTTVSTTQSDKTINKTTTKESSSSTSTSANAEFTAPKAATVSNQKALSSATNKKENALIVSVIILSMSLLSVISLYIFQKKHQRAIIGHQPFTPDIIHNDNNNIDDDMIDPRDDMLNSQSRLKIFHSNKNINNMDDDEQGILGKNENAEVI